MGGAGRYFIWTLTAMDMAVGLGYGRHMRALVAGPCVVLAALFTAPAALASSLSVSAPSSVPEDQSIPVHVTGTADEDELAWTAFVQNEACPATLQEAQNQPGKAKQNKMQLSHGPFDFTSDLSSTTGQEPPFTQLHGTVNVCSYLYREFAPQQDTLATAVNVVKLTTKPAPPFQFFGHMSSTGKIKVTALCPKGCKLKVVYTSAASGKKLTATKKLPAKATPGAIQLPLDAKTIALVKKIRKKHKGGPVNVTVHPTATPPSGKPFQTTRVVKVS
jgi:hypothetical protein